MQLASVFVCVGCVSNLIYGDAFFFQFSFLFAGGPSLSSVSSVSVRPTRPDTTEAINRIPWQAAHGNGAQPAANGAAAHFPRLVFAQRLATAAAEIGAVDDR